MPHVAVIGAGATGLAAAYDLTRRGLNVNVYTGSRTITPCST
jgi:NADPH-dependent 2,4-dienoyl-CoA reductase/sulfur reductase-like enzyme